MKNLQYILFLFIICISTNCKKQYSPPAIKADNKFLVIDGSLVSSADSQSVITLSRTVKLTDTTFTSSPEKGAIVSVEGNNGNIYRFFELAGGIYKSNPLLLNVSNKYRLKITTSTGEEYASDYVEVKQTPAIDSVTWQQQNDVMIYVNTHDPLNNTKYYRWDYIETWQYRAQLENFIGVSNGLIFYSDSTNQQYNCWSTDFSTDILLGISVALSQDVISKAPIAIVPQNSLKIGVRYSILVKQYAITAEAYQYLQILKKNTENLGSIFDAQPTQLIGNIHSVKNPSEVVVGYFTASTVQQKRIFIDKNDVTNWNAVYQGRTCDIITIDRNFPNPFLYTYPDPEYAPYYFSGQTSLFLARKSCLDCRLRGGVSHKPSFW